MKNASTETIRTHNLGYPRIGGQRELKKATEAYWKGGVSRDELLAVGRRLREANWRKQQEAGIDLVPVKSSISRPPASPRSRSTSPPSARACPCASATGAATSTGR